MPVTPESQSPDEEPLSKRFWRLDWADHLPWTLGEGVTLEAAATETVLAFVQAHYAKIFAVEDEGDRFWPDPMTPAKRRFLDASDRFVFRAAGRPVGVLVGQPFDWSTYYWRTVAFLPSHQGRGLLAAALERTDAAMREAGVERVEGEAAPVNYRQVRLLHRLGYCVTGSVNSERWGTLLRLTKFLAPKGRATFASRFCRGVPEPRTAGGIRKGGRHEEVRHDELLSPGPRCGTEAHHISSLHHGGTQ
ncbi:MAG TPA: GNAT family N-acetyltransferase [Sandaracinaceae bacterium LLY-WYZ-13_1]|nr:GNAT family N-acetyltransferase [Sandaracinaceae bacterium LLY-WYZ-13_1]